MKIKCVFAFSAIFLWLCCLAGSMQAQTNFWQQINGTPAPGNVQALLTSSSGRIFAGTFRGVYLSTDRGLSWTRGDNDLSNFSIRTLMVRPNGYLYAGTDGNGVYRSTDHGVVWQPANNGIGVLNVTSLAADDSFLYAGTGTLNGWNSGLVYRSSNDGVSWAATSLRSVDVFSLGVGSDGSIYSGDRFRITVSGYPFSWWQIRRTQNKGVDWTIVLSGSNIAYINAIVGSSPQEIFVGTGGGGVLRSTNSGTSWQEVNTGLSSTTINTLSIDTSGVIYAGTIAGVFLSTNNGDLWTPANNGLTYQTINVMASDSSGSLYAGNEVGLYSSTNNGGQWNLLDSVLWGKAITAISIDSSAGRIYSATQGGLYRSLDDGRTWTQMVSGLSPLDLDALLVLPNNNILAGRYSCCASIYRSTDGGEHWIASSTNIDYVRCLAMTSVGEVFAGGKKGVFRSTDEGINWTTVNSGLTGLDIRSLHVDRFDNLYVGTYGSGVYRSTDHGQTWTSISYGLSQTRIYCIAINSLGHIFVTGDYYGSVFRSTDDGNSWTELRTGLPLTQISALSIDAQDKIFAAVHNQGVYVSPDYAQSWTSVNDGLITKQVTTLTFDRGGRLYAGTYGGLFRTSVPTAEVEESLSATPLSYRLEQNYPNPFNPTTTIKFQIPTSSFVTLKVFDFLGREVATLVNEEMKPGSHERIFHSNGLASGVYLYRMQAGNFTQTRKLLLLR